MSVDDFALGQCRAVSVDNPEQSRQPRLGANVTTHVDVPVADQGLGRVARDLRRIYTQRRRSRIALEAESSTATELGVHRPSYSLTRARAGCGLERTGPIHFLTGCQKVV